MIANCHKDRVSSTQALSWCLVMSNAIGGDIDVKYLLEITNNNLMVRNSPLCISPPKISVMSKFTPEPRRHILFMMCQEMLELYSHVQISLPL